MADFTACFASVDEFNQAFISQECTIEEFIAVYNDKTPDSLWTSDLNFKQGTFRYGEGYIKSKYVFHGTPAPQAEIADVWSAMQHSGTTGSEEHNACDPDCETVEYGFEQKQYQPYERCIKTDTICLEDLKFEWQYAQQMDLIYENLKEIAMGVKEQWNRDTYLGYSGIIPAIPNPLSFPFASGVVPNPVTAGAGVMTQGLLDTIYSYLVRTAHKYKIGMGNNAQPLFGFITSPETSNWLMITDPNRREDIRYIDPQFLTKGIGANVEYRNWVHIHDFAAPRYVVDATQTNGIRRVYPWDGGSATTIGSKWNISDDYLNAPYELGIVYIMDVFENMVLPPVGRTGGGSQFAPQNYNGEVSWINILHECYNPKGNKGHYRMDWQWAPKPGATDHALAFLYKRCDVNEEYQMSCGPCLDTDSGCPDDVTDNVATYSQTDDVLDLTTDAAVTCATGNGIAVTIVFGDGLQVPGTTQNWVSNQDFEVVIDEDIDEADHDGVAAVLCP